MRSKKANPDLAHNQAKHNAAFRPKKRLGQHFLIDPSIIQSILDALQPQGKTVVEIGPGAGALTKQLLQRQDIDFWAVEIDPIAVIWLKEHLPTLGNRLIAHDILTLNWAQFQAPINIIGNFPYSISSQIFFKILSQHQHVSTVLCMSQKEVAERIASPHNSRAYGILSVFLQTYYQIKILFDVPPEVFNPRPKVMSSVVLLVHNTRQNLPCNETLFHQVVKQAFQNRRKMLRNTLRTWNITYDNSVSPLLSKRAEHLSVEDFIALTQHIEKSIKPNE